jgi:hypothetical protein
VFWSLIDRWGIPDETALAVIDRPGSLTRSGKRPRFRLSTAKANAFHTCSKLTRTCCALAMMPLTGSCGEIPQLHSADTHRSIT